MDIEPGDKMRLLENDYYTSGDIGDYGIPLEEFAPGKIHVVAHIYNPGWVCPLDLKIGGITFPFYLSEVEKI